MRRLGRPRVDGILDLTALSERSLRADEPVAGGALMRCSRIVAITVVAYLLLGAAIEARATINLTGHWVLTVNFFGNLTSEAWDIVQAGTALTQTPSSAGQAGPRTGTIDSTSGAFTLSDPQTCVPGIGPAFCTFSGTAAPNGLAFTGTLFCSAVLPTTCPPSGPGSVTAVRSPSTCGNGVVDSGEQCDDGAANGMPGSCCSLACLFVPQGTSCDTSSSVCVTHDVCDGAGHCVTGGPPLTCDPCSSCDPTTAACVPSPATTCKAPTVSGAASITLKTSGPRVSWKWGKGQATSVAEFGDPTATDSYALCVYDDSNGKTTTRLQLVIPSGSAWRSRTGGFVYKDKLGTADGVNGIVLKTGDAGRAKVSLKASGPNLTLPSLPLVLPVAVQLRSHGLCWGAGYEPGGVKKGTSSIFAAKSSPSGAFLDETGIF
jgi:cysteine-rich repeat protein